MFTKKHRKAEKSHKLGKKFKSEKKNEKKSVRRETQEHNYLRAINQLCLMFLTLQFSYCEESNI